MRARPDDLKRYLKIRGMWDAVHEIGYCDGVLDAVERRAAGRPVARIGVRVGALHRIVPAAFEQSFQMIAAGGVADGAGTEVRDRSGPRHCMRLLRRDFDSTTRAGLPAPAGAIDVAAEGGDELVLEWVEYAERRPRVTRRSGSGVCGEHHHTGTHRHPGGGMSHVPGHPRSGRRAPARQR